MFGWLRAMFSSATRRAVSPPRPARFCPSVECLGDRTLPAAGLAAGLGATTANVGGKSPESTTIPTLVQRLDRLDHALANDTLVRIGDSALASSGVDPTTTTIRAVQTEMRAAITVNPQLGNALARVAEDWRSGQGIAGTELGRALQTEIRAIVTAHPLVGDTLAHIAEDWRTGQGLIGMGLGRMLQTEIKEVLINALVRAVGDWRSSPHVRGELDDASTSTTTLADREGPLSWPPSADVSPIGWRIVLEVPIAKWAITLPGEDDSPNGLRVPAATPDQSSSSATGRAEPAASAPPLSAPDTERADPKAEEFITRFLPFDTASLREDVNEFLSDLESVVEVVPERPFPGFWESAAVITAGTGVVLVVGKWRACSARTRLRHAWQAGSTALTTEKPGGS